MDSGEQTAGTRDEQYNLISVLYHALHGAENCNMYALDAEAAGDERLTDFFREAGVMQARLAERAKGMLGILEVPPEPGVRPEGPVPSDAAPEDVPPRSAGMQVGEVPSPARDAPPATDVQRTPPSSSGALPDPDLVPREEDVVMEETPPEAP